MTTKTIELEFVTKAEAAEMCGVSSRTFDQAIRPFIADQWALKSKGRGEALLFEQVAVMRGYKRYLESRTERENRLSAGKGLEPR